MNDIRIDQSHCNYWLSKSLEELGWNVVFRDGGRVNRGGSGNQGLCLGVFERNGLPIPDIVATKSNSLLLIEVDISYKKVRSSLQAYRDNAVMITEQFCDMLRDVQGEVRLDLGFCRMGLTPEPRALAVAHEVQSLGVHLVAMFSTAQRPTLFWSIP